jgi:acyl-CoA thioester hydrolase
LGAVSQFNWQIRVYYEDTDAGGVVYHSNYLNFLERARTEWLRHLGFEQTTLKEVFNVIIVVHSVQVKFKKPALYNDLIQVNCLLSKTGFSSFDINQNITRDGQLLVEAEVKLAYVHADTFRPAPIPANV